MKDILITNVVYGRTYAEIFLNFHLKSLLDPSNIPSQKRKIRYVIFTDVETAPMLRKHPNMLRLLSHCEVEIRDFVWNPGVDRFAMRYTLLVRTFQQSVQLAVETNSLLCAWVADLVFAKDFFQKVLTRMGEGHDSVFVLPARAASEGCETALSGAFGALSSEELWNLCYARMHPLWQHCHWDSPQFTKHPFSLIWNSGQGGVLVRSFSLTPIIFVPKPVMMLSQKVLDVEVTGIFENPYWCHNWDDAPVIGVEPITCYFPAFENHKAGDFVRQWSHRMEKHQHKFLKEKLYYPNQKAANISLVDEMASDIIVRTVLIDKEIT